MYVMFIFVFFFCKHRTASEMRISGCISDVCSSDLFATNIGGAESYGLEFEFIARPVQGLSLALNGSFNRAKVTDLTPGEAAISGAELGTRLASPHFQGSGTLRYDFPIGADDTAYAAVNVSHAGSFPNQFPNVPGNPDAAAPTYEIGRAHV